MGRKKKEIFQPISPVRYDTLLDFDHLTERDKDLLIMFFYKIKHLSSSITDDNKIKEFLHYLDLSDYALYKKPIK